MSLLSKHGLAMSSRDIQAWAAVLNAQAEVERSARSVRSRIASEVGFNTRDVAEVKIGNVILVGETWLQVTGRRAWVDEDGQSWIRFDFDLDESPPLVIERESDFQPVPPHRILVLIPDPEEVF